MLQILCPSFIPHTYCIQYVQYNLYGSLLPEINVLKAGVGSLSLVSLGTNPIITFQYIMHIIWENFCTSSQLYFQTLTNT